MSLRDQFWTDELGFLRRWGPARERGQERCNKKLCLTSTSVEPMLELLYELSLRDDCWAVKLDARPGRHGMVRGRCFLTSPEAVIELWKRFKGTEHVLTTIQDDDFTAPHR